MGWIGNIFIVIGLWKMGSKDIHAFVWSIIGELIWVGYAISIGMYDLAAVCAVFALLAGRNWYLWNKETKQ